MSLTTSSVVNVMIVLTIIPIGLFVWLIIKYNRYRKAAIASIYERYSGFTNEEVHIKSEMRYISNFIEYCGEGYTGIFATMIVLTLAMGAVDLIVGGTIYDTRQDEPVFYQAMIAEKEAIENSLAITTDIVNTQLYESAIAFNAELATYQQFSINPNYKYNFTGDYDWFAIEPIELK